MNLMTYAKVSDVLEQVRRFHRRLKEIYADLSEQADRKRIALLLDYLSRHEEQFEKGIEEFQTEGADPLLDTWLQYGPEKEPLSVPAFSDLHAEMGVDEIANEAQRFNDALTAFYEDVAQRAELEEVQRMFRKLAEQQKEDKAKLTIDAQSAKRDL